ncbi:30S ribosomal protein S13 [Neolewinella lacunae]|uniref:Small ribosomal subunit protein uS13 n=1 Tax=Neolewinella lacunae TaxID=1517758 RepID=A0A923PH82_9BACT|nr:30S ribosomal protein S13 [Neolewinella lacunae]MBC6992570.1 30S ribosomal protein S13 [Neolewinella lacunae]MDN3634312.1 30S ribosomal protein S13 [Neolewinella lacunae]
MARIAGVDLPRNKRGIISLTYVFGVGPTLAGEILDRAEVAHDTKVADWTDENIRIISNLITNEYKVEGDLRTEIQMNIKRLMDIGCYRGLRHRKGLPLRGQRTQTNARTRKGKRKTVANKKKVTK